MLEAPFLLLVIAVVVVGLTSLIKMPWFSHKLRTLVATVVSVAGAGVHLWLTGDFETMDMMASVLQVYGASQLLYQFMLDGTKVDDVMERTGLRKNYEESDLDV